MKIKPIIYLIIILILFISCKQSSDPLVTDDTLNILVKDTNGKKLSGVGLHFYMEFVSINSNEANISNAQSIEDSILVPSQTKLEQNYPNPFNPATVIPFALSKTGNVRLEILSVRDSSVLATLIDAALQAGNYAVQWNGQNDSSQYLTNNIYIYRLTIDDYSEQRKLCLNMADPEHIKSLNCLPIANSDQNGKIRLEYDHFPVGQQIHVMNATGEEIALQKVSSTFQLFLVKDGYKSAVKEINIDPDRGLNISVRLEKE